MTDGNISTIFAYITAFISFHYIYIIWIHSLVVRLALIPHRQRMCVCILLCCLVRLSSLFLFNSLSSHFTSLLLSPTVRPAPSPSRWTSHIWHMWVVVMLIVIACKTQIKTMSLSFLYWMVVRTFAWISSLEEWVHVGCKEKYDNSRRNIVTSIENIYGNEANGAAARGQTMRAQIVVREVMCICTRTAII